MIILRVFVNKNYKYGNPVGIILDENNQINNKDRLKIAFNSEFSEIVFINDLKKNKVSIFNPQSEINFAGHALVGSAWYISKLKGNPIKNIEITSGTINCRIDKNIVWISTNIENLPSWNFEQKKSFKEIEELKAIDFSQKEHLFVWAWINQSKGLIRARTFAPDWGIIEDEANGSGSMKLAYRFHRNIKVIHGKGSIIYTKPLKRNCIEVGGKVMNKQY